MNHPTFYNTSRFYLLLSGVYVFSTFIRVSYFYPVDSVCVFCYKVFDGTWRSASGNITDAPKSHPLPCIGNVERDFVGDTTGSFADFLIRQIIGTFRGNVDVNDVQKDFQNSLPAADQCSD